MPSAMDEVAAKLAVHEAVCAERWKQANDRLGRIEVVLAAIVLLLLVREAGVRQRMLRAQTRGRIRAQIGLGAVRLTDHAGLSPPSLIPVPAQCRRGSKSADPS